MEETNQAVQTEQVAEPKEKTFTQAEVDALLQAESDKRVNQAKARWEKEQAEQKRLAQLSAEDREREIAKQEAEKFQAERDEFEKARAEFERQKMELELVKELEIQGLPVSFSKFLLGTDTESTFANLQAFKTEYQTAVQTAVEKHVEEKLRGTQPASGTDSKSLTKKEFLNLPYKERSRMLQENPDFVHELLNGN